MPKVFSYSTCELIILHFHFSAIRNQNVKRVYLKTTFLKLFVKFDRNISVRLVGLREVSTLMAPKPAVFSGIFFLESMIGMRMKF